MNYRSTDEFNEKFNRQIIDLIAILKIAETKFHNLLGKQLHKLKKKKNNAKGGKF